MQMKLVVFPFALVALLLSQALAESTDCKYPSLIVADGRINQSRFAAGTASSPTFYWFALLAQTGHSYSVEFVSPTDNYTNSNSPPVWFGWFTVYGPNDTLSSSCVGTSTLVYKDTYQYSPVLQVNGAGDGQRRSFLAPSAGNPYLIRIANMGGAGNYSFRVVDTTLFNPRWSTWSGYDTQWGFLNLSDMPIDCTFTVYDSGNNQLAARQFTLAPGGQPGSQVMRISSAADLNLPRNASGYAVLAHTGPPTAILPDAYMLNGSATVVIVSKFETRGNQ